MSIVDFKQISPFRTSPRNNPIDTVTIHCYVGQVTVERMGRGFSTANKNASSNYGVGYDGRIGMFVEECDRAWTTGGKDKNGNPIYVNGISGSMNDHRAITVEVASDSKSPYAVKPAAMEGLIRLMVDVCKRNPGIHRLRWKADKSLVGKPEEQNMTVHRWFANKSCPGDYLYSQMGYIAQEVNRRLDAEVIDDIDEEEDDMTIERFTELYNQMRAEFRDNDAASWSAEAREWAISTGLIQGGSPLPNGQPNYMWEDLMTREQMVSLLYRLAQMLENK